MSTTEVAMKTVAGRAEQAIARRPSHAQELHEVTRPPRSQPWGAHASALATRPAPAPSEPPAEKLGPQARLEALCDPGSFRAIRCAARSLRLGAKATDCDGVLAGTGTVDGRRIVCFAQDQRYLGGSVGETHADTIVRAAELAGEAKVPLVGLIESAGARMQEGTASLNGYGRIFRENVALSGRVPQISVITGVSAGGGSYSPALTDFVVMTKKSSMFLTGPAIVREVMGEDVDGMALGGPAVHERNGVCQLVAEDELDALVHVRRLLSYLPANAYETPERTVTCLPAPGNPGEVVPSNRRKVYDVRDVIARIADGGEHLEIAPRYARNVVTTLARIDGRSVGIVANQPHWIGGVLDAESAQKASRFVRMCDSYNLPILVLVDTPGFMPGTAQERCGVIRHGAKLLHAFAEATVPCVSLVLRQAYGGAYISMNSKGLGADLTLAWPDALIGIMGASQAVTITGRKQIAAAEDPVAKRAELAEEYAGEHLTAQTAAAGGFIDEVIQPGDTRAWFADALSLFERSRGRSGRSGNLPL